MLLRVNDHAHQVLLLLQGCPNQQKYCLLLLHKSERLLQRSKMADGDEQVHYLDWHAAE